MDLKNIKIKDFLNGIETYMEKEFNTEEGNSFFFTGGCYMFADAIHLSLKEIGIKSKILTFGEGDHNFVRAKGYFIDANGGSKTLEELVCKSGMDLSADINYSGLIYSENDKEVNEYKDKILKYAYLKYEMRLIREQIYKKIENSNSNELDIKTDNEINISNNNDKINKISKPLQL